MYVYMKIIKNVNKTDTHLPPYICLNMHMYIKYICTKSFYRQHHHL